MKKILVTAGCSFIGHHFVDYILKNTDWEITSLERLSFSGNLNRLTELNSYWANPQRVRVVHHDLRSSINDLVAKDLGDPHYIVHFAASTHVDRAIKDPTPFYMDNVIGTSNLIEYAKKTKNLEKMIVFSTDEVLGPAPKGVYFKEDAPHNPTNDYSASKSGQEKVAQAAFNTHKFPVIITRTLNNFGERQHPEKFLPKTIKSISEGKPMPMYATVDSVSGEVKEVSSRVWMHAGNTADGVFFVLQHGKPGEIYHIIGFDEYDIITLANKVAKIMGKPLIPKYVGFYGIRPGHDLRYSLDGTKMKDMGWTPPINFEESLKQTIDFSLKNPKWL